MERKRCRWADPASELYTAYHDQEWGGRSMTTGSSSKC